MKRVDTPPPQGSLNAQDVLFIVFRHKWKIIFLTLLGLGAATSVYLTQVPAYESRAKLLVRYVLERSAVDPFENHLGTAGRSGASVMNTEVEILTSQDLVLDVVEIIGTDRLAPPEGGELSIVDAADIMAAGLTVSSDSGSNVLHLSYQNGDPELARDVLREFVTRYFDRHLDIHRSIGAFDFVTEKTDLIRGQLRSTEEELNKLKAQGGIINLQESITNLGTQMAKTREDMLATEAALVEQEARVKSLTSSGEGNAAGGQADGEGGETKEFEPVPTPPAPIVAEYDTLTATLGLLNEKKLELLSKYTPRSRFVTTHQKQIDRVDGERAQLLKKYPGLVAVSVAMQGGMMHAPLFSITDEKAKLAAVIAKAEQLKLQLKSLQDQHGELATLSTQVKELERRKELEEEKFRYLESSLEKARADEALDPSKIPNISIVQRPTVASRTYSARARKMILGLAASGLMAGLGLAFLIELFLDRSVKRPQELESRLHIPLMLTIPYLSKSHRAQRLALESEYGAPARITDKGGDGEEVVIPDIPHSEEVEYSLGKAGHFILPYATAIRDRIVYQMELNEMTHKPKLVALTGLAEGAGTTTIAAGLAKVFAEGGGAKVLLVDLSSGLGGSNGMPENGETHSLDSALAAGRDFSFKEGEDNLYLARVAPRNNGAGAKSFAPKHLYDLMPELRSSEFDYIIFDMPPIGPTSPTVAMAGIMDQVLLVLDAEHTNRDTLKRDYADLMKGRADVSCVFNKTRQRAPRWVEGAI